MTSPSQGSVVLTPPMPHALFTNVSGMHSLIFSSNQPIPKTFKRWATQKSLLSLVNYRHEIVITNSLKTPTSFRICSEEDLLTKFC